MAEGSNDITTYTDDTLEATFKDVREVLDNLRQEMLSRGLWVDSKYKVTPITGLEDDHLVSIIRMLKNQSRNKSKWHKGLHEKTWEEFISEHPSYPHLFREANARNLPGAAMLPALGGNGVI